MGVDIIDYLGKIDDGIFVLISIEYDNHYYDGTFFYTENNYVITINDDFLDYLKIDDLESWEEYHKLSELIFKKLVPYDEMISTIDDFDYDKYIEQFNE